jgi:hypothetical protein
MAQSDELGGPDGEAGGLRIGQSRTCRHFGVLRVITLILVILGLPITGCSISMPIPYVGFQAIQPEQGYDAERKRMDVPTVDSLQPELVWGPFPGVHMPCLLCKKEPFIIIDMDEVTDVTYHLRIWHAPKFAPGEVVYDRRDLVETSHRLEQPLEPDSIYFWSVRARFRFDGNPQLTEWSLSNLPFYDTETAYMLARRIGTIPPRNYYRFRTPPSANAAD